LGVTLAHQNPPKIRVRSKYLIEKVLEKQYGPHVTPNHVKELIEKFNVSHLLGRELYFGFSGGEVKRFELLTIILQKTKLALLDEPDSGVDLDSIKRE